MRCYPFRTTEHRRCLLRQNAREMGQRNEHRRKLTHAGAIYLVSLPLLVLLLIAWPRSYFYHDRLVIHGPAGDGDPYWYSGRGSFGRAVVPHFTYTALNTGTARMQTGVARWLPFVGRSEAFGNDRRLVFDLPYWCALTVAAAPWFVRFRSRFLPTRLASLSRFSIAKLMGVTGVVAVVVSIPTEGGVGWIVLVSEVLVLLVAAGFAWRYPTSARPRRITDSIEVVAYLGLALVLVAIGWDFLTVPSM